ncbi:MAG TPA: hypothetical protein VN034_06500 [Sphingopyxis sp.]|nr:hypothetical protein [Sphingopyxis sp.]
MNCADLNSLLTRIPRCRELDGGSHLRTDCLYPSSDPVMVFVKKQSFGDGFRVDDCGGAWRSAQRHGSPSVGMFDKASRRYSVNAESGMLWAESNNSEWLVPAILAVANASAMAARAALEMADRNEKSLNGQIQEVLMRHIPPHRIAKNYEYRGRSGHMWPIDFAVTAERVTLIKSVVQNGNSINSTYAAFGDIGDDAPINKYAVFDRELKQDSTALIRQVADLVPMKALEFSIMNA